MDATAPRRPADLQPGARITLHTGEGLVVITTRGATIWARPPHTTDYRAARTLRVAAIHRVQPPIPAD